ncbi:MAG: M20/M25/M40 family metallo-hydrolase [Desulfobacterales bacterium]|nr:M20/M25/M40 family metallo-hydrolase [Desulfobacterales bacterium]
MINEIRLAETFEALVRIDSVSREEGPICRELARIFQDLGAATEVDGAGEGAGSDSGNLIVRIDGNRSVPTLMFCAHMDTVETGRGVVPVFKDGVFTSAGDTILGADDKSALAILIEAVRILKEQGLPHGPIELVFTICEEIGLYGAKGLDPEMVSARFGWALDTSDTDAVVTRAPSANQLKFTVYGKSAHAGSSPEKGVNAIVLASRAVIGASLGRIDDETTANIGTIKGGVATNIVPDKVTLEGEARSHDPVKLDQVTGAMVDAFTAAVAEFADGGEPDGPRVDVWVTPSFSAFCVPDDHPVVTLARQAATNLGRNLTLKKSGGGSDANVFCGKGIVTGVLGTGMCDVHTSRESIRLADMVKTVELVLEIIKIQVDA